MEGAAFDYGYRALACATLLLVGLGVFARLMWVRTRLMLTGRPETRWDLVRDRAVRLLQIGIGQRKMFKEQYAGALHAFTFWGFLVVQIRALQLFGEAFVPGFEPLFALQPLYDIGKDFTELVVIVTVGLFFYRRLVTQPARIHYSGEALLILGFIGWLMLSDLLYDGCHFAGRALLAPAASQAGILDMHAPVGALLAQLFFDSGIDGNTLQFLGEFFYWGHLAVILTMLNLLPISKHFHVITALPNVFLSNLEPTGALEAVEDIEGKIERGERLGIGKIEDLSWKQMLDLYTCTECGRCTVNCPAWNTDKPLSPAFIIKDLQTHLYDEKDRLLAPTATSGEVEHSDEELPPLVAALNPDAIWSCTTCRSCSEQCPVMIEHVDKIVGVRRHLLMNRNSFPEELVTTLTNLENKSNPWGIAASKRDAWAKDRGDVPTLADNPNPEYLYFVGCAGALDDRAQKVTDAVVTILKAASVDFAIIGRKEKCSGDPARRMGHEYLFQESAKENIDTMQKHDIRKVIATCPHCFNTIKNEYPQLGGEFEVIHHTQLIRTLLNERKLTLKEATRLRITYHDSCYMGRYNEEYDAPRDVLTAVPGLELVEMERSKQMGMCCGAGGARMFMEEKIGSRVNHLRVEQAMETKPEVVAVNCPWCMTMVKDGLTEKAVEGVVAKDIAEILVDALELPDYAKGKCQPVTKDVAAGEPQPESDQPSAAKARRATDASASTARKRTTKKKKKKATEPSTPPVAETAKPSSPSSGEDEPPAAESSSQPNSTAASSDEASVSPALAPPARKKRTKKKKKAVAGDVMREAEVATTAGTGAETNLATDASSSAAPPAVETAAAADGDVASRTNAVDTQPATSSVAQGNTSAALGARRKKASKKKKRAADTAVADGSTSAPAQPEAADELETSQSVAKPPPIASGVSPAAVDTTQKDDEVAAVATNPVATAEVAPDAVEGHTESGAGSRAGSSASSFARAPTRKKTSKKKKKS